MPPSAAAGWRSDETPAELVRFATLSTSERALAFLDRLAALAPERLTIETLGASGAGRPIVAAHLAPAHLAPARAGDGATPAGPPVRALVFAQQHGDEPAGHEACLLLLRDLLFGRAPFASLAPPTDRLDLWVVAQVNPDGAAHGRRRNAGGLDLNRGHHMLDAPEVRLLYGLYHRVRPHVTVDLHQFNVERHRFADGALSDYDVMADAPTSPNVGAQPRAWSALAIDAVREALAAEGYAFRRYLRGDPADPDAADGLRHSTVHAIDGRNVPAVFGSLAFIVEATRYHEPLARLERRVHATYATVAALLRFAAERADEVRSVVGADRRASAAGGGDVALRTEYRNAPLGPDGVYRYVRPDIGERGTYYLPRAKVDVDVTRARPLPRAYWLRLPDDDPRASEALAMLAGHGIRAERLPADRRAEVERHTVESVAPGPRDAGRCLVDVASDTRRRTIPAGELVVRTDQPGGKLAGILLEPDSMDGLLAGGRWPATVGDRHPIERILEFDRERES